MIRPTFTTRLLLVGIGLLGGLLSAAILCTTLGSNRTAPLVLLPGGGLARAASSQALSVADVAERSLASVVNISASRHSEMRRSPFFADPFFREFFRQFGPDEPSPRMQQSLGSGVILSSDGVVVTNNHVVKNAERIRVTVNGKQEFDAKIVGTDPKSDLAVLKLTGAKGLHPIRFGDSERLRLGDAVLAIGNPFGVGQTVTMGIVSAKGRANVGIVAYEDFIQTDAAINPGNSGGALLNMQGELIGINTAILSGTGGYQGIGFAIPSKMVRPISDSLLKRGRVTRGWLGVAIQDVNRELANAMKLPTADGVLISDVDPSGPALRAGLRRGDLVVRIDGKPVRSTGELRNMIAATGPRAQVKVELYRDRKLQTVSVTLAELPARIGQREGGRGEPEQAEPERSIGLTVGPVQDPHLQRKFNIPSQLKKGVVVVAVEPDGAAARTGIQPGDVILEVNRATMTSVRRFSETLRTTKGDLLFLVNSQGTTHYVIIHR